MDLEQREGLQRMIVPGVRQFPGFIGGNWTVYSETSESIVLLSYDSLSAAESMAENIRGNADNQRQRVTRGWGRAHLR
jgi:hypothetical protein